MKNNSLIKKIFQKIFEIIHNATCSMRSLMCFFSTFILFSSLLIVIIINFIFFYISNSNINTTLRNQMMDSVQTKMDMFFDDIINRVKISVELWQHRNQTYTHGNIIPDSLLEHSCTSTNGSNFRVYHLMCQYPLDCYGCFKTMPNNPQSLPTLFGGGKCAQYFSGVNDYRMEPSRLRIQFPYPPYAAIFPNLLDKNGFKPAFYQAVSNGLPTLYIGYIEPYMYNASKYYHVSGLYLGENLNTIVENARVSSQSFTFIIGTKDHNVLASSDEKILKVLNIDSTNNKFLGRVSPINATQSYVINGYKTLVNHNKGDLTTITKTQNLRYFDGLTSYYIDVQRKRVIDKTLTTTNSTVYYEGLDWLVLVIIAEKDVNGLGIIMLVVSIVLMVLFLTISVLLILSLVFLLTSPLHRILKDFKKVEDMQLDKLNLNKKFIFYENYKLWKYFTIMVLKLKEYRAFIPSYLLEEEGHNEEGQNDEHDDNDDEKYEDIDFKEEEKKLKQIEIEKGLVRNNSNMLSSNADNNNNNIDNNNNNLNPNIDLESDKNSKNSKNDKRSLQKLSQHKFSPGALKRQDTASSILSRQISGSLISRRSNRKKDRKMFKIGLQQNMIVYFQVKILNPTKLINMHGESEYNSFVANILDKLKSLSNSSIIVDFMYDTFILGYNTKIHMNNRVAFKRAIPDSIKFKNFIEKSRNSGSINNIYDDAIILINIHKKRSQFGTMGSKTQKKLLIAGKIKQDIDRTNFFFENFITTSSNNSQSSSGNYINELKINDSGDEKIFIIMNDDLFYSSKNDYHVREVPLYFNDFRINQYKIYQLIKPKEKAADGEWMYALEAENKAKEFDDYHKAIEKINENKLQEGLDLLKEFLKNYQNKNDYITKLLIQFFKKELNDNDDEDANDANDEKNKGETEK